MLDAELDLNLAQQMDDEVDIVMNADLDDQNDMWLIQKKTFSKENSSVKKQVIISNKVETDSASFQHKFKNWNKFIRIMRGIYFKMIQACIKILVTSGQLKDFFCENHVARKRADPKSSSFFVTVSSWYHHGRPRQVNPQVTPSYLELRYKLWSDSYSSKPSNNNVTNDVGPTSVFRLLPIESKGRDFPQENVGGQKS